MQQINLKDEVQKVLAIEWQSFAQRHPHLAEAIDQTVLAEQATANIGDDPEYLKAMDAAAAAGAAGNAVLDVIGPFVKNCLGRLLGGSA
jgi:hypothetical protein